VIDAGGPAPALIPLERELRERVAWFIGLRRLAAAAMVLGTWGATAFLDLGLSPLPLYAVGLAVAAYNLVFRALSQRPDLLATAGAYQRLVYAQIGLDWVALGFLIYLTGGIRSPVVLGFAFHLIIGAILLPRLACYLQAVLASLLVGLLLLLEIQAGWPVAPVYSAPLVLEDGVYRWLVISAFFAVTAFLTTSIAVPLRRKEEALFASEQALDRAYGEAEALYRVGQAVNATLELDRVLGLIAENAARLMGMKACSIRLLDGRGEHLRVGAAYGLSQAYLDKGPVETGRSGLDAEALAGNVVQVAEAAVDPRFQYPEEARREGIRAVLCAPMQAKGRSIGCIRVYSAEPHRFSKAEENLLLNLANLGSAAIENARAYAELQALSEERAWFARVTHHQLRAPLAAVQGMLDALRYAGPLSDKQGDLVERGRRRVREMLELIRDLLDLAAAQRPRPDQAAAAVPLLDSLARTLETVRDRAAHKGVLVQLDLPDPEVAVLAEAGDVDRVFANLLDNAVKYTPRGGSVTFAARRDGDRVEATVSDTGIGIVAEDQERIFGGFYRSQAAKESGEVGTGMGLSIVRQLVQRWGGELTLSSASGEGSRFTVRLPAAAGPAPARQPADG
jgi:signal transduction histidine kinase